MIDLTSHQAIMTAATTATTATAATIRLTWYW